MSSQCGDKMDRRGWIVWAWSKLGSLILFTVILLMLLTTYAVSSRSLRVEAATHMAQDLRNAITDTYDSIGDASFEYPLPPSVQGENYSIELQKSSGNKIAVLVRLVSNPDSLFGAASLSANLSQRSNGLLKGFEDNPSCLCISKYHGVIYVEASKCS